MRIIDNDIERYTGYAEFSYDGLVNCHPNDEKKMRDLTRAYKDVVRYLEILKETIDHYEK